MTGAYRVVVQNRKIKFDFEIRRNITILRGDSATGKTTLVEMIREYEELGPDSGIELQCEKDCVVLSGRQWEKQLADLSQSIVFIDEGNAFTASKEFAAAIQKTDNYYVLVTREGLETLPYSVTEIYGIRASKHFGDLKQTYNEFFRIYGKPMGLEKLKPTAIITEDSNSGFQFFQAVCAENGIFCESAGGKSNIFKGSSLETAYGESLQEGENLFLTGTPSDSKRYIIPFNNKHYPNGWQFNPERDYLLPIQPRMLSLTGNQWVQNPGW